jgi:predicted nucleic acid-binding protein
MTPRQRVFLDANVVFAGLYSAGGAPGVILQAHVDGAIVAVVSHQVIEEIVATIRAKRPDLASLLFFLLQNAPFEVQPDAAAASVTACAAYIHAADAPILAATIEAQPDALVTGNTRHFTPAVARAAGLRILTPAQFVDQMLS